MITPMMVLDMIYAAGEITQLQTTEEERELIIKQVLFDWDKFKILYEDKDFVPFFSGWIECYRRGGIFNHSKN